MNLINKIKNFEILDLLNQANQITLKKHGNQISLERAIFLSWWCDKGDCSFCYMSTQKPLIKDPKKARRRVEAILGEVEVVHRMGWNIEFLSGGYGSFTTPEIKNIAQDIHQITGNPVWLNIGITKDLASYGEEVKGITGAVEVVNPELHRQICPSKPLEDILGMLELADELGFQKAITIILGLGETPEDLNYLFDLIEDYKITRVTFYSLNPHEGTSFAEKPQPASMYYAGVVAATRIRFPDLEIITGTWIDNLANIGPLILAGANGLTKFPLFSMFGTRFGARVEEEVFWTGRKLEGTFTNVNTLKGDSSRLELQPFVKRYIRRCLNNKFRV
ncbi:MAG TPA: radical SAM protein [Methanobacteriaceae archaeon]|nr:radical SAM protein [Methanobacteriaceae archaeon]